jgi:hypothetical protein
MSRFDSSATAGFLRTCVRANHPVSSSAIPDPEDPIPSIDFSSEMALALLLGQRPTTGYQIRIARMTQRGSDTLVVAAVEIVPCVGATVITYPLTAFAVPRSDGRVTVEWSREGPNCQ